MPLLQNVAGKSIAIFCRKNIRPLLAETLTKREALVTPVVCYQRQRPIIDSDQTLQAWQEADINLINSTSPNSLENLVAMVNENTRDWLFNKPLLVISDRMAKSANTLGFKNDLIISDNACDEAVLKAMIAWYAS